MKILLVNDDGYGAEGIEAMYRALAVRHEVLVIAPDRERSGAGHSVTLDQPIHVVKKPLGYAVSGTPADCTKLGVNCLMKDCDLVVAGINAGANLGVDCHYSGTAAAAREAAMQGKQALAVSCWKGPFADADYLAEYAAVVAEKLVCSPLPKGTFLNLNLPNAARGQALKAVAAPLGWFIYEETYQLVPGDAPDAFVFMPKYGQKMMQEGHFDLPIAQKGLVTLTPVSWDCTQFAAFHAAQEIADEMKDEAN